MLLDQLASSGLQYTLMTLRVRTTSAIEESTHLQAPFSSHTWVKEARQLGP